MAHHHHFFPGNLYGQVDQQYQPTGFTPLFRLLEDFDRYSTGSGQTAQGQSGARTGAKGSLAIFQPKFDVRETEKNYELIGELPGAKRENIHIEFSGPQSITVRGRIERTYTAGNPPAGLIGNQDRNTITDASQAAKDKQEQGGEEQRTASPHRATVRDEAEEEGTTSTSANKSEVARTSASEATNTAGNTNDTNNTKYWITERSIGEFTRTFSLPDRIDQDGVSATFNDGVLTVTVPKAKKHEVRRINVE